MTHQELLKLYGIKGHVLGLMGTLKCELRANHDLKPYWPHERDIRWLEGRSEVAARQLSYLNRLRREVCQIIKEAESD